MAQPMPESVKIARIGGTHVTPDKIGYPFSVPMGRDEVMVLLSIYYWFVGSLNAGTNTIAFTLWKKTDSDPPGFGFDDSPDIILHTRHSKKFVTESQDASGRDHLIMPWPLILIRSPRVYVESTTMNLAVFEMRLFYLLRDVSDVDLAKLMVKDHA